ncbi:helix-turn-helix domain-containing protein [Paenibacillus sp. CAU 1782]
MMKLYGAEHHLMVVSDAIDAEEHGHSFVQVAISLDSVFQIEVEGQPISCAGIVIQSNVAHSLNGAGHPLLMLLMDGTSDLAASFKRFIGEDEYGLIPRDLVKEAAGFARNHLSDIVDGLSYQAFLDQLLKRLGVQYMQPAIADERIEELIQLVKECTGSEHSVGLYAGQLGLSNSRLSHLFKENTGTSLSGYILLHKLQKACYLIFRGVSITDAAMAAGFDSPSHFAATSKRLLGMTAKDIRKDSVFLQVSCLHGVVE